MADFYLASSPTASRMGRLLRRTESTHGSSLRRFGAQLRLCDTLQGVNALPILRWLSLTAGCGPRVRFGSAVFLNEQTFYEIRISLATTEAARQANSLLLNGRLNLS